MIEIIGYITIVYCLFLVDTFSQLFSNQTDKRQVHYSMSTFHNPIFIFFVHKVIGIAFPAIVLFILLKWYWAIPLYFVLVQIIFKITSYIYDRNLNIFKVIVLSPMFFAFISIALFSVFMYLRFSDSLFS